MTAFSNEGTKTFFKELSSSVKDIDYQYYLNYIPSIPINTGSQYFLLAVWFGLGTITSIQQIFKNTGIV